MALVLASLALAVGFPAQAYAADPIVERLEIKGEVDSRGSLTVTQTFTFGAEAPESLTQRLAERREAMDNSYYAFAFSDITARLAGQPVEVNISSADGFTVLRVPTASAAGGQLSLSYTVHGAVIADPQGAPLVSWRMLQGLSLPVRATEGELNAPAVMSSLDCTSGPPNSVTKCSVYAGGTHEYPNPYFSDGPRGAGEAINLEVSYAPGALAISQKLVQRWSLDRAFSLTPATVLGSLALLLLGGAALWALHRRHGSDRGAAAPMPVAQFVPVADKASVFQVVAGASPGMIGTVADERVDPIDITATLLDLAVRGHLRIHEIAGSAHRPLDWVFERLDRPEEELRPFERLLVDAVAPADGKPVAVSTLRTALGPVIGPVQDELYREVVDRGWFEHRPDATRGRWGLIGRVVLAASVLVTVALVAFTAWALLGLALVGLAIGLVMVAERMPRRTGAGSALLAGLGVLAGVLQTQPTGQMPKGREYAELSKVLPYAVVLGGKERWIEALVRADDDPGVADPTDLHWYHASGDWHLSDLPAALHSFVTTVQGELFSR